MKESSEYAERAATQAGLLAGIALLHCWRDHMYNMTANAQKAMRNAGEEANGLHHERMGVLHILIGMLRLPACMAKNVLLHLHRDPERILEAAERMLKPEPESEQKSDRPPLAPRANRVVQFAHEASRSMCCSHVGTEHLLLGVVQDMIEDTPETPPFWQAFELNLEMVRDATIVVRGGSQILTLLSDTSLLLRVTEQSPAYMLLRIIQSMVDDKADISSIIVNWNKPQET